jgi:uncharacterized DUF497 family protein
MSSTVRYVFRGVSFEWNSDKADSNLSKHGIGFDRACEVFFDPFVRVIDATQECETRDAAIGYTETESLLCVVHLARDEEIVRIISARPASRTERQIYEQH